MPTVSIIVTTYNRKEYLRETIQSILNQTYQDYELIVIDNFSNYDFFEFIRNFRNEKIIPFQNHNNGIIAVNRNYGIAKAKGNYLAFCDDDDIWINTKLEEQIRILDQKKCDLVFSNMFLFSGKMDNIISKTQNKRIKNLKSLIKDNPINLSSVIVRNKDIKFPQDSNLMTIEDYALWIQLFMRNFKFEVSPEPLIFFRISEGNSSSKNWDTKHLKFIYLYTSILIENPQMKIKAAFISSILVNFLKFSMKNFLLNHRRSKLF